MNSLSYLKRQELLCMKVLKTHVALEGLDLLIEVLHIAMFSSTIDNHVAESEEIISVSMRYEQCVHWLKRRDLRVVPGIGNDCVIYNPSFSMS